MAFASEQRRTCPVCAGAQLSRLQQLDKFPVLPVCTLEPSSADVVLPLDVGLCDDCGLLQLLTLAPRELVYAVPHSEGIGPTWMEHYRSFEAFIVRNDRIGTNAQVLEVGAGNGQLASRIAPRCQMTVIEPNYQGPRAGLLVVDGYFDEEALQRIGKAFDVVYSSHTLEHFFDFRQYFAAASQVLREGGLMLTAVPNLESALQGGYANALNFEHTAMLTLPHLQRLCGEFGFEITEVEYFRDHGIYFGARKTSCRRMIAIDTREYMRHLWNRLLDQLRRIRTTIEARAEPEGARYLFGASQLSQFLFVMGLEPTHFDGVLDNAAQKHGKRLYGTSLLCAQPGTVLPNLDRAQVFINAGPYTHEIHEQLTAIAAPHVELIEL